MTQEQSACLAPSFPAGSHHSPPQGTRAPGDTADSGGRAGNKRRLRRLTVSTSKEMLKNSVGGSGHRRQLRLPLAQSGMA